MMKAFVTGSTGLLGSNLTRLLLEQGYEVVALARSPEKARAQLGQSARLSVVRGDIEDNATFVDKLAGCDVLFHCAAYFRESFGSGDHWPKLKRINVDGTIDLLNKAEAAGVKRVIYVSSSATIGHSADGRPGDESTPPDANLDGQLYAQSKVLAEQEIAKWLKTHALPVVLILPTWIYGPQDAAPTAAGQLVIDFLNRQLPAIPPGGSAIVDVRDVAQGMINAVERGRSGERYILNNEYQSLVSINALLEKISGVPATKVHLSYPIAVGMAWVMQTLAALQGKDALITVAGIRTMQNGRDTNAAKARRELGFAPRPFADTLRDTVAWFRANQPDKLKGSSALGAKQSARA
jgi:dihydroflavonol-4-reductase